jgi:ankyrin repeat protein
MIGNLEISQYLVSEGADVDFLDDGATSLALATGTDNVELVQLLLGSGADPDLHSVGGLIPLFVADKIDIARALVAGGANVHITDSNSWNLAFYNNVEKLHFLLERGVDPNPTDDRTQTPQTPLHSACCSTWGAKNAKAWVELLLQFGANTVEKASGDGVTPVDYAMQHNYPEVVKILEPLVQDPDLQLRMAKWLEKRKGTAVKSVGGS